MIVQIWIWIREAKINIQSLILLKILILLKKTKKIYFLFNYLNLFKSIIYENIISKHRYFGAMLLLMLL